MNAKISVVIPVYNVEPYVRCCVESVLKQSFGDFDVILVDDGSTDGSGGVCDEYAKRDGRVHVIHQQNGGLSAARNAGIEWVMSSSTSEYVTFVDSDDWIDSRFLEMLYRGCVDCGCRVAAVGVRRVFSGTAQEVAPECGRCERMDVTAYWMDRSGYSPTAWAKLYAKSLLGDIRFPPGRLHEDEFTTHRLVFQEQCIAVCSTQLYAYRQRIGSITRTAWSDRRMDAIDGLKAQQAFFSELGREDLAEATECRLTEALDNLFRLAVTGRAAARTRKKLFRMLRDEFHKMCDRLDANVRSRVYETLHPMESRLSRWWRLGLRRLAKGAFSWGWRKLNARIERLVLMRRHHAKMRLGVSYNLFDGEELLEASALSIRTEVDFISVVYQDVSNMGERKAPSVLPLLERLKHDGVIDDYRLYEPVLGEVASFNERRKRVLGMDLCAQHGCTHFISMDVDEFFRAPELAWAKGEILRNGIDVSAVSIVEYVKSPEWRLVSNYMFPPGNMDYCFYMPFIVRIRRRMFWGSVRTERFPCLVDPTRDFIRRGRFYLFPKHMIAMHHMSTVRKDLAKKYRNSSFACLQNRAPQVAEIQAQVLGYSFNEKRLPPDGMDFIGRYPVMKVRDEFRVDAYMYGR